MTISRQQDKELQQKLKYINTVEIQSFISQFHNSNASNKTFSFIEENFIKKYRYKNNLNRTNTDGHSSVTQFINGFKQTSKFYQSYHQYIQSSLDKFTFTKDLKKFITQLYKSQSKTINFFLAELEFHRVFIAQNEAKYHKKVESMSEICSSCKQNMVRKSFQSIKQEVGYNFSDPYKLYDKGKHTKIKNPNNLSYLDSMHPLQRIQQLQEADMKMKELYKESKKIDFSKLDEIYDHFDTKQEFQLDQLNREKVSEMFYDLQTQLDNQSSQLQQYVDELIGFNDRLVNYYPNSGVKALEQQEKYQTQPKDVQKELRYNFGKIIRKIYQKITQIIEKRKSESVNEETQVNFTQQLALKQMQKQKRRLQIQLKQSKEEKKFLTTALKQEKDTLKKQIQRLSQENNRIDISRQEAILQKNNIHRKQEKLIKMINQLKKQIERLSNLVDRKQYLASKKQLIIGQNRLKSRVNLDNQHQQVNELEKQEMHDLKSSKRTSKRHLIGISKVEHNENLSSSKLSVDQQIKSFEQQFIQEMERHQLQLINSLAKKKLKKTKKKYLQPRRSKLLETITVEQSDLQKQVSRFSQARLKQMEEINKDKDQNEEQNEYQNENNEAQDEQFDDQFLNEDNSDIERIIREPTIKEVIEKNENQEQSQQQNQHSYHQQPKNHKSKTFTKINQKYEQYEQQSNQRGQSSRSVSETQEDIYKKLEQLRKLKKMKQIEIKLAALNNKNPDGSLKQVNLYQKSTKGFQIQKQVQQSFMVSKNNKSVDRANSQTKKQIANRGVHHQSLYKDDLLKRFGRSSQNFQPSLLPSKSLLTQLQPPQLNQNPKVSSQQRKSSVSIASKNFLSLCEQVTNIIQVNKSHVGIQTLWPRQQILRMLYQFQLQSRNWNQVLVPFDCYKFGYQEFLNQLCQLIAKQQKNPIRKLNGYKGSSEVLKKPLNYRFNKENFFYFDSNGEKHDQALNLSDEEVKMKRMLPKASDQKHYFVPRFSNQYNKSFIDDPRMNQTTIAGFFGHQKIQNEVNEPQNLPEKPLLSSVSLAQLKSIQKNYKTFDSSNLSNESNNPNFKKKGFYSLNQMKTDVNSRETNYDSGQKEKLPTINQPIEIIKIPSFQKQDAENLFFTIQSAKTIEENIKSNVKNAQNNIFTLENMQIRFTTQILAILAHIHLLEPYSYNQIKNIILYPAKVLTNKRVEIQLVSMKQNQNEQQDNETQLSLKNGLGYVIQLHRKCNIKLDQSKQRSRTKDNFRFVQNNLQPKTKNMCDHLVSFRKKIGGVIRVHQALKSKALRQQNF